MARESNSALAELFTTTSWSDVELLGQVGPVGEKARERFARAYQRPLYILIRSRLSKSGGNADQAEDILQSFWLHLFGKGILSNANSGRGQLRCLLCVAVLNFTTDECKHQGRQKNRPSGGFVPIGIGDAEQWFQDEFAQIQSPERAFDRAWALEQLRQTLKIHRHEYSATGRAALFEKLEPILDGSEDGTSYAEIAAELGTSESNLRVSAHRFRRRFRELLDLEMARSLGWNGTDTKELKRALSMDANLRQLLEREREELLDALRA